MSVFVHKLRRFLNALVLASVKGQGRGYRGFRFVLYGAMFVIFFTPLVVATGLSSFEYKNLLEKEEQEQLLWHTQGAQKTIEAFVHELQSVVKFVSRDYSYEKLLEKDNVSRLFAHLKNQYPGFVDLGVIAPNGIQERYAGPFQLKGYDYNDQDWYVKVLSRRLFISEVFMGYRKLPHFVIAVSNKMPDKEEYWVLRLSIDYETLQNYVSTISTKASQDIFLVNSLGVLQTRSSIFGVILEKSLFFTMPRKGEINIRAAEHKGTKYLKSYVHIKNSPWILVIVKEAYTYGEKWSAFRLRQRMIVLGCTLLALVVIVPLVNTITNRLREADEKRNLAMTEAEHTDKLASIGRLAAGVGHEINNPLAIIDQKSGLMTDLLAFSEEFKHKEKLIQSINGIQKAVERCKVITHRLLGFARRMDVVFEQIDINDLLREVLGFLEREAIYNRIHFELVFADDLPMVFSDRGQLQQIFLNITNNAIDAIGMDGEVVIATSLSDEGLVDVCIKDTGPGMSSELMKRIFDPFFTTKEAGMGTGLGLSITYGLVKKLGGNISVDSEVGRGSTFNVSLPVNDTRQRGAF
nr:two-component sensor histidine kinase [Desulfobulbaceae bacterium]